MPDRLMCPYFLRPCLADRCTAFDLYTQERFKDKLTGEFYSLSKLKSIAKTMTLEQMIAKVTRVVETWEECTRLGKVISSYSLEDNYIPNYLCE